MKAVTEAVRASAIRMDLVMVELFIQVVYLALVGGGNKLRKNQLSEEEAIIVLQCQLAHDILTCIISSSGRLQKWCNIFSITQKSYVHANATSLDKNK